MGRVRGVRNYLVKYRWGAADDETYEVRTTANTRRSAASWGRWQLQSYLREEKGLEIAKSVELARLAEVVSTTFLEST